MSDTAFNLAPFLGHFHPVLVHLPIGGLMLAGILEALSFSPWFKDAARTNKLILAVTAGGFVGAAVCGWLLAQSNGYDQQLLRWHRWSGLALTLACLVTLVLSLGQWQRCYRCSLFVTLALLLVASHLGGSITHGSDFLTRNAPAWVRSLLGVRPTAAPVALLDPGGKQTRVFYEVIQPILSQRCSECHGSTRQKGRLRLDSLEGLLRGGANGAVLAPGKADHSEIVRRLLLPAEQEDHMPPPSKPQPTPAEIDLLQAWINNLTPQAAAQDPLGHRRRLPRTQNSREQIPGAMHPTTKENVSSGTKN